MDGHPCSQPAYSTPHWPVGACSKDTTGQRFWTAPHSTAHAPIDVLTGERTLDHRFAIPGSGPSKAASLITILPFLLPHSLNRNKDDEPMLPTTSDVRKQEA
jgi:hypothetical protein